MEELIPSYADKKSRHKKKSLPGIDMTPMVDLGFLLITFFIFTTTLAQPSITKLTMPADTRDGVPPNELKDGLALTFLLGDNKRVYYYHGSWEKAKRTNSVLETNFSYRNGIGSIIREKQQAIDASLNYPEGRDGIMVIIKHGKKATYQNTIDVLDEMLINAVKRYAIVDIAAEELKFLESRSFR
jgi:biopolymer transport protein ExbD